MEPESLTRERWQQIEQFWNAALERPPDERAAFLAEACAGDEELRREVESLLRCDDRAGSFIEEPALEIAARLEPEEAVRSLAGQRLDQYEILSLLGAGGMGEVWRARDSHLDREVAIKVLPAHLAQDSEALARFQREARAVAALSHPNILAIHDFGNAHGISYAVTELLEGETLRDRLERSALPWRRAVEIGIAVADGLAAAHAKGIIHRDLKPENIFLTADGRVKILDFGLARIRPVIPVSEKSHAATRPLLTRPGIVLGTIGYMSPEQVRGDEADAPGDIFLLGCVLYEMVTGRRAFAHETAAEELNAILNEAQPAMAESANHVPPELEYIVSHCLEKKPEERFQSAQDLAFALRTISFGTGGKGLFPKPVPLFSRSIALISGALLLLLFGVALYLLIGSGQNPSLVILPFDNDSPDPETEYLSDGIAESVINRLSQLPQLRVIPRTTAFSYKRRTQDPRKIGSELGVRAVLTGRAGVRGDILTIQAELVDVASGLQIWGERYNRKFSDIFAVQEGIAREISEKLSLRLTGEQQQRLSKRDTQNPEAYQLYLKGHYHWQSRNPEGILKGIDYLNQAIAKDPNYALAYADLAAAYILMESPAPPTEAMLKAREAATMALKLDDTLAEAHTSLAAVSLLYDWNWSAAEREFKQAITLNQNYSTAHQWYAQYLTTMGQHEAALAEIRQALELDPRSLILSRDVGWHYYYARLYDQAIDQARNTLDLDQNFTLAHTLIGRAYVKKRMFEVAIEELQKAIALSPGGNNRALLGYAYAAGDRKSEAQQILDTLQELSKEQYISPVYIAAIYGELGESEQAFTWLEKAYADRSGTLILLNVNPMMDSLRADPKFRNLVQRLNLPQ
ncbi:MAG TPA: protein kinase [Blastocatellia bacterium]|nr:protein kinase [Blastocatellia bacterium]